MSKNNKEPIRRLSEVVHDLKHEINDSDNFIKNEKIDSLFNEIDNIVIENKKANKGITYFLLFVLIYFVSSLFFMYNSSNQIDTLNTDIIEKRNTINRLQWSDSLFTKFMSLSYDSINEHRTLHFLSRNGKEITYPDLMKENDSLLIELTNIKNENRLNIQKLSMAKNNYGINFKETSKYITIFAPRLDSALLLLPYYKEKIHYDKDRDVWTIEHP
ncbi:hypothetical protein [Bacteroides intestinalis]|uniref:Uncharacterized protein n=1 Tax=Bacteroides intestinalis TaxID=329854 RepID=A0AAQ0LM62_9BACE|nr:hypothetical protein [Bacteroides intestinalis]RGT50917.1 hypothetical protein DWX27_13220 [Bacteroides intestinalis]